MKTQDPAISRRASLLLAALSCCSAALAAEASFQHYRFTPVKLRNDTTANSIQMAGFEFLHLGLPVSYAGASASNPGGNTPAAEVAGNLIDGSNASKWLDFFRGPVVFSFPSAVTIDGYRFTTANDAIERDPVRWLIEGSPDGSSWTVLDYRDVDFATPTDRAASSGDIALPETPAPYVYDWTGAASSEWNTLDVNWDNGAATTWVNGGTELARFGAGVPTTLTLPEPISARHLDFTAPGYLIQGNVLTLTNVTRISGDVDAEVSSEVAGTVGVVKTGSGTLTLSGNNTFTGPLQVRGGGMVVTGTNTYAGTTTVTGSGSLSFAGAATKAAGFLEVGTAQGKGTLLIGEAANLVFNGTPVAGTGTTAPGAGVIRQTGGTATFAVGGQYLTLANTVGSYGSYELSGGTMSTVTDAGIRVGWNGPGVLTQSGGSLTSGRWFAIGGSNSDGVATFTGGTATTIPNYRMIVGDQTGSRGTINIGTALGGTALVSTVRTATGNNDGSLAMAAGTNSTGILNLNDGTLKLHGRIYRPTTATGSTAVLNLNGGILQAGANNVEMANSSLTAVRMLAGGVTIDTNGNAASFAAPIQGGTGNGINIAGGTLPVTLGGSGFVGAPVVTVTTDGGGSGATAIATVTGGSVSSVLITCPGVGYEAGDTVSFLFSDAGVDEPAEILDHVLTAGDLAPNATGGLVKTGAGVLTMTQPSSFTGPLTVEAGSLLVNSTLAETAATVAAGATFGGSFNTAGSVVVNGTLAPGSGVGSAQGSSSLTLGGGATYEAQIVDWDGAAGTGYDTVDFAIVSTSAASGNVLTIRVDATGLVNFTESARDFVIATADAPPSGFEADNWAVDATGFPGTGTWSLAADGNSLVLSYQPGTSGYGNWIASFPGLPDTSADADPELDGIANIVEYVLNGAADVSSTAILPEASPSGDTLVFSFVRRAESKSDTTQILQYGSDLESWTDVVIPASTAGNVQITPDTPSAGLETVVVTIPAAEQSALFARLKVTQP